LRHASSENDRQPLKSVTSSLTSARGTVGKGSRCSARRRQVCSGDDVTDVSDDVTGVSDDATGLFWYMLGIITGLFQANVGTVCRAQCQRKEEHTHMRTHIRTHIRTYFRTRVKQTSLQCVELSVRGRRSCVAITLCMNVSVFHCVTPCARARARSRSRFSSVQNVCVSVSE
jgi:hypothetical protein